jgi:hypothetical protein
MAHDPHAFDDDDSGGSTDGKTRRFTEFDCPDCNANNPYGDGFGDGDEVLCNYCGEEYRALVSAEGRLRLRAT